MSESELSPAKFGAAFKAFMEAVTREAAPQANPVLDRIKAHLGADPVGLPVVTEELDPFEQPNVQVALDEMLARPGWSADLVGIAIEHKRYMALGLSDLLGDGGPGRPPIPEGPVDFVNFKLADERILPCVQYGLYLIANDHVKLIALVAGPTEHGPRPQVRVEVIAGSRDDGLAFLADLREAMGRLNVYRGKVISLSPGALGMGPQTLVAFHTLPSVGRDDLILPPGVLERIERHTVIFAEQADRLLAAGRSLKRGVLLHGPPGVGKTLTVMYLVGRMPGRTSILATGLGMGLLQPVVQMARSLAPAMVVLEDVDLIAEERDNPFRPSGPLLFELLNELDGLADDCDVIFVLTTNRPETLEPALAARPGRVDLAVEFPLPNVEGRRRLLELYARGLELRDVDLDAIVKRTDGATPAFIKELLRKAAVFAAIAGPELIVDGEMIDTALDELKDGGRLTRGMLGFTPAGETSRSGRSAPRRGRSGVSTGFGEE